jgi:hypothetical protein
MAAERAAAGMAEASEAAARAGWGVPETSLRVPALGTNGGVTGCPSPAVRAGTHFG